MPDGDIGARAQCGHDLVPDRAHDLLELVARGLRELALSGTGQHGHKGIGPSERFIAVAELRELVSQRGLQPRRDIRDRHLELVGAVVHRSCELRGAREEGPGGRPCAVADVVPQADPVVEIILTQPRTGQVEAFGVEAEFNRFERGRQRHRGRVAGRKTRASGQGQPVAAIAEEGGSGPFGEIAWHFLVAESQVVEPFAPGLCGQGACGDTEVTGHQVSVIAALAAVRQLAVEVQVGTLLVHAGVVAEGRGILRDITDAGLDGAGRALRKGAGLASPLRGIRLSGGGAGGGQHAKRGKQEQGAIGSHGRIRNR